MKKSTNRQKKRLVKVTLSTAIILGFVGFLTPSYAANFTLNLPDKHNDLHKLNSIYIGKALLANGVKLPAYKAYYSASWSSKEFEVTTPEKLNIDRVLSSEVADKLVLYYIADTWFLIPKGWQLLSANEGANGSRFISFAPPNGQNGHFLFEDSGACYGCGVNLVSPFFQQADRINQDDYGADSLYRSNLQMTNIRPSTKAWRYTVNEQNIDGLSYWNQDGDSINIAQNVQVSLPSNILAKTISAKLATTILNWWF